MQVMQLALTEHTETFDVLVNVKGGGLTGKPGDSARDHCALMEYDATLRGNLSEQVVTDTHVLSSKKYGQPGARRKFQFLKLTRTSGRTKKPLGFNTLGLFVV